MNEGKAKTFHTFQNYVRKDNMSQHSKTAKMFWAKLSRVKFQIGHRIARAY